MPINSPSGFLDITNATNIASGTLDVARVPTLNQSTTGSAATLTAPSNTVARKFSSKVPPTLQEKNLLNSR